MGTSAARFLRRVLACAALIGLAGAAAAQPSAAQITSFDGNCSSSGCHGSPIQTPDQTKGNAAGNRPGRILNWPALNSATADLIALRTRPAGSAMSQAILNATSDQDLINIHSYLRAARNGVVTVSPAGDFADTGIGNDSAAKSVTLRNYRGQALGYSATKSGTRTADFLVTDTCAGTIPAATDDATPGLCTISVVFHPLASASASFTRLASLDIVLSASGTSAPLAADKNPIPSPSTYNIALQGLALGPRIVVSPTSLNFLAHANFDSATSCAKVSNTGSSALTINNLIFTQPTPAPVPAGNEYARSGTNSCAAPDNALPTCAIGSSVAAGGSCMLVVQFTPKAVGTRDGSVSITHSDTSNAAQAVDLFGTGQATPQPVITLPGLTSVPFGEQALDGAATSQGVQVRNNDSLATLTWAATRFEIRDNATNAISTEFTAQNGTCSNLTLGPSTTCLMQVSFRPQGSVAGLRAATLRIFSDATNNPVSVPLTGSGAERPGPTITPSGGLTFPTTVVEVEGAGSDLRTVDIENRRSNAIGLTTVLSGADAGDFLIKSNTCGASVVGLAPPCRITLAFKPRTAGGVRTRSASLDLSFTGTGGDPSPGLISKTLSGDSIGPLNLPASLALAAQATLSGTATTVLTNRGVSTITLNTITFEGALASEFTVAAASDCRDGKVLGAGASCDLVVRFAPLADTNPRNATLRVAHTGVGSSQTINLIGTASAAPQGHLLFGAPSFAFSDVQLASSSTLSITLRNDGDLALAFTAFPITGANAADFERSGTCSAAAPLAINAECQLTVTFRPGALGARSATLTVQSNASNGAVPFGLGGNGVPIPVPVVSLVPETPQNPGQPATLAFGDQTVGGIYPARTVRLSNSGTADLAIASIVVEGAAFADVSSAACPATLTPQSPPCTLSIRFTPAAANTAYSGTLRVVSNAAGSPHTVVLTGRGTAATVPVLAWVPAVTTLDYGNVAAGTVSAVQSATLVNQGPGGATLSVVNAVGTDAAVFSVADGTCRPDVTLFEGDSCRVDARFAPTAAGARTASVQVASNGSFPPTLTLSGVGLGGPTPGFAVSVASIAFGATRVGAHSEPSELKISSTGSGALRVTGLAASGPYVVQATTCPAVPFSLPAGSDCTVAVMFVPQAEGSVSGTLTVTTDASATPLGVALSGEGEAKADVSSGGCSIAAGDSPADPTLWALVLLAIVALLCRSRARARRHRAS